MKHATPEILCALRGDPEALKLLRPVYLLTTDDPAITDHTEAARELVQALSRGASWAEDFLCHVYRIDPEAILSCRGAGVVNLLWGIPMPALEHILSTHRVSIEAHVLRFFGKVPPRFMEECLSPHKKRPTYKPLEKHDPSGRLYDVSDAWALVSDAQNQVTEICRQVLDHCGGDRYAALATWVQLHGTKLTPMCPALRSIVPESIPDDTKERLDVIRKSLWV